MRVYWLVLSYNQIDMLIVLFSCFDPYFPRGNDSPSLQLRVNVDISIYTFIYQEWNPSIQKWSNQDVMPNLSQFYAQTWI